MLTGLQVMILEFAKKSGFHGTLREFIESTGVNTADAIDALKDLRKKRIASVVPNDFMDSWIGVTNQGWKKMGWN